MFLYTLIMSLWAADLSYANVDKGEPAPFTGKLLTHDALAEIIATHENELLNADLEREYQVQKLADELNLKYDLYAITCQANEDMYKKMLDNRDEELKIQARKDWIQRAAFIGGFALGSAVTIGITYSVNQN